MFDLEKEFISLLNRSFNNCDVCNSICPQKRVNDIFDSIQNSESLGIYGVGKFTKSIFKILSDNNKKKISFFCDRRANECDVMFEGQRVLSQAELLEKKPGKILVSSSLWVDSMKKELLSLGFLNEQLIILDSDLRAGIISADFNDDTCFVSVANIAVKSDLSWDFVAIQLANYKASAYCNDSEFCQIALKNLIFAYLGVRDMCSAQKYINEYIDKELIGFEILKSFSSELNVLLNNAKDHIMKKKSDDVIIYLFDGMNQVMVDQTNNIKSFSEQAFVFEKAYTQYCFTTSTMQVLFTGKDLIDEGACEVDTVSEENSPLLASLADEGYSFRAYVSFPKEIYTKSSFPCFNSSTMPQLLWHMLGDMCKIDENCVYYTHFFETHPPYRNGLSDNLKPPTFFDMVNRKDKTISLTRRLEVFKMLNYVDEQWAFFDSFIKRDTKRIIMSDHGNVFNSFFSTQSKYNKDIEKICCRTKLTLYISAPNIPAGTTDDLFSVKSFKELLLFVLDKGDYKDVTSEYCKLQILPYYSARRIEKWSPSLPLPLKGIVTYQGVYIFSYDGTEIYYPNKNVNCIDDPQYREEIEKCRKLCGKDFHGIFDKPKFALAKEAYTKLGLIKG